MKRAAALLRLVVILSILAANLAPATLALASRETPLPGYSMQAQPQNVCGGALVDSSFPLAFPASLPAAEEAGAMVASPPFAPSATRFVDNGVEQWYFTEAPPEGRIYAGVMAAQEHVYLVGGEDSLGSVYRTVFSAGISGATKAIEGWVAASNLLAPRTRAAAIAENNFLYVAGGQDASQNVLSSVEYSAVLPDGSLQGWTATSSLNTPRYGASLVVVPATATRPVGRMYVVGGSGTAGNPLASIERALINPDGSLGAWTMLGAGLLTARTHLAAAFAPNPGGDFLYALGGSDGSVPIDSVEKAVVYADGSLGAWQETTPLGYARQGLAALFFVGYLFAFGGETADHGVSSSVEYSAVLLDGSGDLADWQPTSSMLAERAGLGLVAQGEHVYALGGRSQVGPALPSEYALIRGAIVVPAPRLTLIQPPGGPNNASIQAHIQGYAFLDKPQVQIGNTVLGDVTFVAADTLQVNVPAGMPAGKYDLLVMNPDGQTAQLADAYTVYAGDGSDLPAPSLSNVLPTQADNSAAVALTANGSNFNAQTTLYLNETPLQTTFVSATQLSAAVPPGLPPQVYAVRAFNADGKLAQLNDAFTLRSDNSVWRLLPARFIGSSGALGGVLNNRLHLVTGIDRLGSGRLHQSFNPTSGLWSYHMDHSGAGGRFMPAGAVVDGRLYSFGGMNLSDSAPSREANLFDPLTGRWQKLPDYPVPSFASTAVSANGKIYIFGGEQGGGRTLLLSNGFANVYLGFQYANVYIYDPTSRSYLSAANLPTAVSGSAAAVLNGKVYLLGGWINSAPGSTNQVYDIASDTWSTAAELPAPRAEAAAVVLNNRIYLLGGQDGQQVVNTVFEFDPAANRWTERPTMTTSRAGAVAGVIGGKAYIAGGRSLLAGGQIDTIEEGTLTTAANSPKIFVSEAGHEFGELETSWRFDIRNLGSETLNWSLEPSPAAPWLSYTPANGSNTATITVNVARDNLTPGIYQTTLQVKSNGGQAALVLSMSVARPPELKVEPSAITFDVAETSKFLSITNLGGGSLNWTAVSSAAWLGAAPASGSGNSNLALTVDRNLMSVGENTATLSINSTGGAVNVQIKAIKGSPIALSWQPASIDFRTNLTSQPVQVSVSGSSLATWQVEISQPWLTLDRQSGQGNGTFTLSASRAGLQPGEYESSVHLFGDGFSYNIPVHLTVPQPPALSIPVTTLNFGSTTNQDSFQIQVDNGPLSWSITDDMDWLEITPVNGNQSTTVNVKIYRAGKLPGNYSGTIVVSSPLGNKNITVSMNVPSMLVLRVTPTEVDFGGQDSLREVQIQNAADPASADTAFTWNITGKPAWLSLSKTSGSGAATIRLDLLRSSLPEGNSSATLTISAAASGQPAQTQSVTVKAYQAPAPQLELTVYRLDFGNAVTKLLLGVKNSGGGTLSWVAVDNKSWISVNPPTGTNNTSVEVTVNRSGLSAGQYTGEIVFSGGGQSRTVNVIMDVDPPKIDHLTIGNVTVRADNFALVSGTKYRATGSIKINDKVVVTGSDSEVYVDQSAQTISGKGTIELVTSQGRVAVFRDSFNISPSDALISSRMLAGYQFLVTNIASFNPGAVYNMAVSARSGSEKAYGEVQISIKAPPNPEKKYTLRWELNVQNRYSGSLTGTVEVQIAGVTLRAQNVTISGAGLKAGSASLIFPASLGGDSYSVYGLTLTGNAPYIQVEGGGYSISVSNISFGGKNGFAIKSARLSLDYVNGKLQFSGEGKFSFVTFAGKCELDIDFTFVSLSNWSGGFSLSCSTGVPIGNTGFFITGINARIAFGENSFNIEMGLSISGGPYVPFIDAYAITGNPTLFFGKTATGFELGLKGTIKTLKWDVSQSEFKFRKDGAWEGVSGSITVSMSLFQGTASLSIWQDGTSSNRVNHFRGDAVVKLVLAKGSIINTTWVKVPGSDITLAQQSLSAGEFTKSNGTKVYGMKGAVKIAWVEYSVFVDGKGAISDGSGITVNQLASYSFAERLSAAEEGISAPVSASTVITSSAIISETAAAAFALGWDTGDPRLRLIDPDGQVITETSSAANVHFTLEDQQQFITITDPPAGEWQVEVYNLVGNDNHEVNLIVQALTPEVELHSPTNQAELATGSYHLQGQVSLESTEQATLDLFYMPAEGGLAVPIALDLPLSQPGANWSVIAIKPPAESLAGLQTYWFGFDWDTRAVPHGEYQVLAELREADTAPRQFTSLGTVQVSNLIAPPAPQWQAVALQEASNQVDLAWFESPAPDLAGYRLHIGYVDSGYERTVDLGNRLEYSLSDLELNREFTLHLTSYDSSGNESLFSEPVSGVLYSDHIFLPVLFR